MKKRIMQATIVLVVVLAAAQFIRPEHTNPPIDASRTIQAQMASASGLSAVLDRACNDCHSNRTVWPWYTDIAPLSWLMARGVAEGRKAVNFSEWGSYPPEQQQALLALSCQDAKAGRMPVPPYTLMHPEAKLSAQDVDTICAAARPAQTNSPDR